MKLGDGNETNRIDAIYIPYITRYIYFNTEAILLSPLHYPLFNLLHSMHQTKPIPSNPIQSNPHINPPPTQTRTRTSIRPSVQTYLVRVE